MRRVPTGGFSWVLLLPYCLLIAFFLAAPVGELLEISLRRQSPTVMTGGEFTFANYARLADPFYGRILWQTVRLSVAATIISTCLAYPLAYYLARSAGLVRAILSCLVTLPLMTSIVVKTFGWYVILGRGGPVSNALQTLGWPPVSLLGNDGAVLVGLAEFSLPFMAFSLAAAIERIPPNLEEAATNLGASRAMTFVKVILPLSRPGLVSGFLLCFGVSSSAYVVPSIMGSPSGKMVAQQIFDDVLVGFNWPGAAAVSVALLLLLGGIVYAAILSGGTLRPR